MAGIERLEIHSKSYIVRWVKVDEGHTLSWSVQPIKKSINFGVVKYPSNGGAAAPGGINLPPANDDGADDASTGRFSSSNHRGTSGLTAQDILHVKGFIPIKWVGKCEADTATMGAYDVPPGQSGMYGLVFDNTFSRQTSKTANFVLLTYPTGAPPQGQHVPSTAAAAGANASQVSLGRYSNARANDSGDSIHSTTYRTRGHSISARSEVGGPAKNCHVGTLSKRKRKRGQGYARRFFSLDYSSCTLSYYHDRSSSALRGSIPLSLAAIAADQERREFIIDSGAEVWHLRAATPKDFTEWANALERASKSARGLEGDSHDDDGGGGDGSKTPTPLRAQTGFSAPNPKEDREWLQVETLVSRIVGTRDALRRMVKDMAAAKNSQALGIYLSPGQLSASDDHQDGYFPPVLHHHHQHHHQQHHHEKRSFWKRKTSAASSPTTPQVHQSTLTVPLPNNSSNSNNNSNNNNNSSSSNSNNTPMPPASVPQSAKRGQKHQQQFRPQSRDGTSMHENCDALLKDLDSVVQEFTALIASSKRRRAPPALMQVPTRTSMDTMSTDEFFDAEAGDSQSQIIRIDQSDADADADARSDVEGNDSSSGYSLLEGDETGAGDATTLFPPKPKSLAPLPITDTVQRRKTVPSAKVPPPSLIGFVRKNVGKDLSTISMPVSANEPTSLLQKFSEQLEFADLIDKAAQSANATERMRFMAAFAVSQFSNGRAKERAVRKPFNPLLGETFELLRSETEVPGGMRLLVEKVCHRPVRFAVHADSARWSFAQSPAPGQKFWGKSAEITTEGKIRIVLRLADGSDELYSWNTATMYLRNVVMGEKYIEPSGTMNVVNDSTGAKAVVEFRNKGMFGGRSEDVHVEIFNPNGGHSGTSLTGSWTNSLKIVENGGKPGAEIWKAGPLIDDAATKYGMTPFAVGLNEITPLESGKLPPTDSRLRPDQRLLEEGDLDAAEEWKVRLEEAQRARRRDMEERGVSWKPRWFVKVSGHENGGDCAEVWRIKGGKDGYWEERARGSWTTVENIFDAPEVNAAS